ncbi:MAG: hypothetical protein CL606_03895 [Anaerolineaceae bacterium]|nr:hypothetical protein [Anaerolineaceae bacterium]
MGIMQLLMSTVASGDKTYVEDLFNPDLYSNPAAAPNPRTITNGVNLLEEGGLVWVKNRSFTSGGTGRSHVLFSTANSATSSTSDHCLMPDNTDSLKDMGATGTVTWNDNGWSVPAGDGDINGNWFGDYVAWSFRKCPGFLDIVTYDGSEPNQTVPHNLGCVPGMMIVKRTNASGSWCVWHKGLTSTTTNWIKLEENAGEESSTDIWNSTAPTKDNFTVGDYSGVNANGGEYVAYLFADGADSDAQVFGKGGNESIIKMGHLSIPGTGLFDVDLGWEPQYVMIKKRDAANGVVDNWQIHDNMREFNKTGICWLEANTSNDEEAFTVSDGSFWGDTFVPYARGFKSESSAFNNANYIYMAIRRGPMKEPTAGTDVFAMDTYGGTAPSPPQYTSGFPPDMEISFNTDSSASPENRYNSSRLLGEVLMYPNANNAEVSNINRKWDYEDGMGSGTGTISNYQSCLFRRAPGFFDVVAYNGDASNNAKTVYHNLGVKPELIFTKCLSNARNWIVTCPAMGGTISGGSNDGTAYDYITGYLDLDNYFNWRTYSASSHMTQDVTTTTITYAGNASGGNADLNYAGYDYVAYLFASKSKVSAIGQYTGTGSAVNVDCGFVAPARFVLIKRIGLEPVDVAGDWYLYDSKRGISSGSGNDPYILLNTTDASTTTTDYIDQYASGFTVTSSAPAALNDTGTYLYLAIA